MSLLSRRSALLGLGASLVTAPAIVRAASIMPVRSIPTVEWASGGTIVLPNVLTIVDVISIGRGQHITGSALGVTFSCWVDGLRYEVGDKIGELRPDGSAHVTLGPPPPERKHELNIDVGRNRVTLRGDADGVVVYGDLNMWRDGDGDG